MRNIIWNVRQEKLRINTFTLQRTCVIVYETLMSQASAASGRGEGGARPSPHSKIFVFKSLQSWGGPLQTAQTARSFSNVFALFLTSLRNVIIIIINILAQFSILHRKKRGSKQRFRYEQRWANSVLRTEYEYEYYSAFQNWPNTNTNIIRASKNDRIRIRILFGSPKTTKYEYEYYSAFQKWPNTNTNIIGLSKNTNNIFLY